MEIILSAHTRVRMQQRSIDEIEIETAIKHPDKFELTVRNRRIVYKRFHDKIIKIVYTIEKETIVVITVILYAQL